MISFRILLHYIRWLKLYSQEQLNFLLVKTDNRLAVDQRYGGALVTHGKQLFQRRWVLTHVLVNEGNTFLRKILFLFVTRSSARLRKDNY